MQALFGQLLIGLINGAFYAMLSLGLAVIFGLLNIINFTHGAQYMMGAFVAWFLLTKLGIGYWWALLVAPIVVGAVGVIIERTMLARLYKLDHLYGLLLTFGLALVIQGLFRNEFGSSGLPYQIPSQLTGGMVGWGASTGEASSPLRSLLATFNRDKGLGAVNWGRYSNVKVDYLIEQALQQVDDDNRRTMLQKATELAMSDVGLMPIHFQFTIWATKKNVTYIPRTDEYTLAFQFKPASKQP